MAATALPRASLPPSGPLPSLPIPKSRSAATSSSPTPTSTPNNSSNNHGTSFSGLPLPSSRSPSAQSLRLPSAPGKIQHSPSPSLPRVLAAPGTQVAQPKSLRKTISIGAFPQPPRGPASRPSSRGSNSPLSHPTSPDAEKLAAAAAKTPNGQRRSASQGAVLRKPPPRTSSRSHAVRNYTSTPSLLNGGDGKSVSLVDLHSQPPSRAGSLQGLHSSQSADDLISSSKRGRHRSLDDLRSDSHKDGKDTKGNVVVSVRVRPDAPGSEGSKSDLEWMVDGRRSLVSYRGREGGEYIYDNVFATHDNNAKVYDSAAKRLVRRVMEGYHGTVFAYGMTGTGKTFSMQGTATSPGVIPLAITDIFSFIRETPQREFLLRVSYLEIYNEKIHDLLSQPVCGPNGQPLPQEEIKLREDSKRGVYASPLKEEIVQSPTQLLRVIARGDTNRRVAGTQYNTRSSRSHAVVQIVVESRARAPVLSGDPHRAALAPSGVRVSTLSLIDLAGSERASENKERRTEGAHINKSLLTLGTVISKISVDKDGKTIAEKDGKHLPYRDSKLTRLLQSALQGNSLISILCTIQIGATGSAASAQNHTGETLNTLKFASRAKNNIVSHAKKADEAFGAGDAGSRALLDRYRLEIIELRKQLEAQSNKATKEAEASKSDSSDSIEKLVEEEKAREAEAEQRHEEQMLEMQLARTALKERIEHLNRLILSSRSIGVNSNRSLSVLSMRNGELINNNTRSARSSTATLDGQHLNRTPSASGSLRSYRASAASNYVIQEGPENADGEEEDSFGELGDGTASQTTQIRALQTDLTDKNRYIQTLEKRLLQARRSSHSRVSMQFSPRFSSTPSTNGQPVLDEAAAETLLAEKDAEIADLRARLDDKERMLSALRSAARKRDVADLGLDTGSLSGAVSGTASAGGNSSTSTSTITATNGVAAALNRVSHRTSSGSGSATSSGIFSPAKRSSKSSATSPVAANTAANSNANANTSSNGTIGNTHRTSAGNGLPAARKMEEMTKLLDEMITERVHTRTSSIGATTQSASAASGPSPAAAAAAVNTSAIGTAVALTNGRSPSPRVDSAVDLGKASSSATTSASAGGQSLASTQRN